MDIEDFKAGLDELGIPYFEAGNSLKIKTCPACGSEQYKVHLRAEVQDGLLFGRCYAGSCQTNFSSMKYLLMSDMAYDEALQVHGRDRVASLQHMVPDVPEFVKAPVAPTKDPVKAADTDISAFFHLKDWITHPAAQYALKRGALPEWDWVMFDHPTCAVVFVVYQNGKVVGYQRRYLKPNDPKFKTKSSDGFKKSEHILVVMNPGKDIVVVEGPFTAVSAYHFGYTGICTFGASVSDEQIRQIVELAKELKVGVGVGFDDDAAGDKGLARIRAAMFWSNTKTFKLKPSVGNDLNEAWEQGGTAILVEDKVEYNPAVPELRRFI